MRRRGKLLTKKEVAEKFCINKHSVFDGAKEIGRSLAKKMYKSYKKGDKMEAVLWEETYVMVGEDNRRAEITFRDGKFHKCMYRLVHQYPVDYSLEDWEFLGKVAREIKRLTEEHQSKKEG